MPVNQISKPVFVGEGLAQPGLTPQGSGIALETATGESGYAPVRLNPLVEPPPASWPFIASGQATIPAIGSSVIVCQETVPKGMSAVIWRVANGTQIAPGIAGWVNGNGALLWKIMHNGQIYQYFNVQKCIFGLVENDGSKLVAPLRAIETETVALILYNVGLAPAGQISLGLLSGYVFPRGSIRAGGGNHAQDRWHSDFFGGNLHPGSLLGGC